MLTPEYLDGIAEPLQAIYSELETNIMADIARRIAKTNKITNMAAWQTIKLQEIGASQKYAQQQIARALNRSNREVKALFKEAGLKSLKTDAATQKAAIEAGALPADTIPITASAVVAQVLNSNAIRTLNTMKKLTGTIAVDASGKLNQYMDECQLMVQSGAFTEQQAIDSTVKKFAKDSISAFDYASGIHTSVEAAVRRACVTGVNQATGEVSLSNAAELGTDLVEVTSHADARPAHAAWQGGIYSISGTSTMYRKLSEATGYGTGPGLCGWNCRHSFYAFIEGVSEQLDKEPYNQKTYKAEQIQRKNERQIRNWKKQAATLEAGGVDNSKERAKVAYWQAKQREHINDTGLVRMYNREKAYNKTGTIKAGTSGIASKANKLYNTGSESENIKAYMRDKPIRDNIQSGKYPLTIDTGKQGKHVIGHNNYIDGRSYLTITENETQELVKRYAGTGYLERDRKGNFANKELITANHNIGVNINNITGEKTSTDRFYIHYSKNGVHIVPTLKGE